MTCLSLVSTWLSTNWLLRFLVYQGNMVGHVCGVTIPPVEAILWIMPHSGPLMFTNLLSPLWEWAKHDGNVACWLPLWIWRRLWLLCVRFCCDSESLMIDEEEMKEGSCSHSTNLYPLNLWSIVFSHRAAVYFDSPTKGVTQFEMICYRSCSWIGALQSRV